MTAPRASPQLRGADVDGDLVLLDIARDAYLCLPGAGAAWRAAGGAGPNAVREGLGQRLTAAGLCPEEIAAPAPPLPAPQRRIGGVSARPRLSDALRMAMAYGDLLRRYHGRSFAEILAHVRAGPPGRQAADATDLARLCAAFHTLVVWLPVSDKCLERSFLLLRFLRRSGLDARWRFGVRLWPFAAHCWLQVGETALDEWPERLAAYVTIHEA